MAISASSKILASDVSGKIDTAGAGLTKSGTTLSLASLHSAASTIGSSSAQTLAYSGTFTIPYITRDTYGRVTGGGTRTLTMPAKPSGGTSTAVSAIIVSTPAETYGGGNREATGYYTFPSGGSWRWASNAGYIGQCSGGSRVAVASSAVIGIRYA